MIQLSKVPGGEILIHTTTLFGPFCIITTVMVKTYQSYPSQPCFRFFRFVHFLNVQFITCFSFFGHQKFFIYIFHIPLFVLLFNVFLVNVILLNLCFQ